MVAADVTWRAWSALRSCKCAFKSVENTPTLVAKSGFHGGHGGCEH